MVKNLPAMYETWVQSLYKEGPQEKGMATSIAILVGIPILEGNTSPVVLPGESHGQRSLVDYSPWGRKGSDPTEQITLSPYSLYWSRHWGRNRWKIRTQGARNLECGIPRWFSGRDFTYQRRRHRMWVQSLGWDDPLEEEMATVSNILTWKIPWTEQLLGYSP